MRSATPDSTDQSNIITDTTIPTKKQVGVEDEGAAKSRRRPNQPKRPLVTISGCNNTVIIGSSSYFGEKVTEPEEQEQELPNSKEEVARQLKAQGKEEMKEVRVKQEVESPDSGREKVTEPEEQEHESPNSKEVNAAQDDKEKQSSRDDPSSPSTSAVEHRNDGSGSMESSPDDRNSIKKRLRLSKEYKREHNGSSAPKKAKSKSKDGLKEARGSSDEEEIRSSSESPYPDDHGDSGRGSVQDIFYSVSSKDIEKALDLKDRIDRRIGARSGWIYPNDIKPGDILDDKITQGITKATVMVCLMSQNFLDSTECEMEVQVARQLGKEFIEVQFERINRPPKKSDGTVSSVMMALTPRIYVPLYKDVGGSQKHFEDLITGLEGMLAPAVH